MQHCGFCSMVSDFLCRTLCVGSRRGSSDTYYRELGDQDTLRIDDNKSSTSSTFSNDVEEIIFVTVHESQPQARRHSDEDEIANMEERAALAGRFLTLDKRRRRPLVSKVTLHDAVLLDGLQLRQLQCILNQSALWEFNAFALEKVSGGRSLSVLCGHLFQEYGLISHYKLDAAKLWKLFRLIEEGYHSSNPYHNAVHAADVTQAMHCFLQQKQILPYMEPQDLLACLLAAIAHDLDHPGVNQSFLIATSHHLAKLYDETSVLENHHWRTATSCLFESGLMESLQDIWGSLQGQISALILATDIMRQHVYLSQFKGHMDTNTLDLRNREHRFLVMQIALKCADISNPCRPWDISRTWSHKVCEEFFRQGDYEQNLKLPVSPLCDRTKISVPKIQIGFFKFVVTPLMTEWHRFLQNDLSTQMLDNVRSNQKKWETLIKKEVAEETHAEVSCSNIAEDDAESGSNLSNSSELLLPERRSSLNPIIPKGIKEQLRRFSVPLNVFQDTKFRSRERNSALDDSEMRQGTSITHDAEYTLNLQLSTPGRDESAIVSTEINLSTENLLPDSTTTNKSDDSIGIRQQCFGNMLIKKQERSQISRSLYASNEDITKLKSYSTIKSDFLHRFGFIRETKLWLLKKFDTEKTERVEASVSGDATEKGGRREDTAVGSRLRDNLSAVKLDCLDSEQLSPRRKSMPADATSAASEAPKERNIWDFTVAIPELFRRTVTEQGSCRRRRGSAPAPVEVSDLLALAQGSFSGANGARKKPSAVATCQQLEARTSNNVQGGSLPNTPRRSSLPIEVMTGKGYN